MTAAPQLLTFITALGLLLVALAVIAMTRAVLRPPAPAVPQPVSHIRRARSVCPEGMDRATALAAQLPAEQTATVDSSTPGHVREPIFIP